MTGKERGRSDRPPSDLNRTLFIRDNLDVMRGMDDDLVDLIYLDPPFNSKRMYSAPLGGRASGQQFKDIWELDDAKEEYIRRIGMYDDNLPVMNVCLAARATHGDSMYGYLVFMARRLIEMKRILSPTGTIYLHCDPHANSYLRMLMDAIFGKAQFRNEIIWCYAGGGVPKRDYPRKHDTILRYSKGREWTFNVERKPYGEHNTTGRRATDNGGTRGVEYNPEGTPVNSWWVDVKPVINWSREKVDWATQKPVALLRRILKASSRERDLVLDPFAGCCTCAIAAETLNRQWVGIDWDTVAEGVLKDRLDTSKGWLLDDTCIINVRTDIPKRLNEPKPPPARVHKAYLYKMQEGLCAGCNDHVPEKNAEVDHIEARAGDERRDELSNLQVLCADCNRTKGSRGMAYLRARLARRNEQMLFASPSVR